MKNIIFFPVIILFALVFNGCSKSDDDFTPIPQPPVKPEISFTFSGDHEFAPAAVSFANTTTNASSYKWYFGDNYTSTEGNPVHVYATGGIYTVKLIAVGEAGIDSSTETVTVLNAPTILKITSITLTDFSFVNNSGLSWDSSGGKPDVYFKITDIDSTVFFDGVSSADSNVTQPDLPVIWNLASPFSITDFSEYKAVKIYDYDFPYTDEYIGKAGFIPSTYATVHDHYPDSIHITNADVFITLSLKWQ